MLSPLPSPSLGMSCPLATRPRVPPVLGLRGASDHCLLCGFARLLGHLMITTWGPCIHQLACLH